MAVLAPARPGEQRQVISLGEAKWGKVMTLRHVERLRRARALLAVKGYDTNATILTCYSGAGFDPASWPPQTATCSWSAWTGSTSRSPSGPPCQQVPYGLYYLVRRPDGGRS